MICYWHGRSRRFCRRWGLIFSSCSEVFTEVIIAFRGWANLTVQRRIFVFFFLSRLERWIIWHRQQVFWWFSKVTISCWFIAYKESSDHELFSSTFEWCSLSGKSCFSMLSFMMWSECSWIDLLIGRCCLIGIDSPTFGLCEIHLTNYSSRIFSLHLRKGVSCSKMKLAVVVSFECMIFPCSLTVTFLCWLHSKAFHTVKLAPWVQHFTSFSSKVI